MQTQTYDSAFTGDLAFVKTYDSAFTGDLAFVKTPAAAEGATLVTRAKRIEVAPSHFVECDQEMELFRSPTNPRLMFLKAPEEFIARHTRPNHTHAPVKLSGGAVFKVIRQRENGPEGYRTVED